MEDNTHSEWDWVKDIPVAVWDDDWLINDLVGKTFKYKNSKLYNPDFNFKILSTLNDDLLIDVTLNNGSIYQILRPFSIMKRLTNRGEIFFI